MSGGFFEPNPFDNECYAANCHQWSASAPPYQNVRYSAPRMALFRDHEISRLEEGINHFLARDDIDILAVSPATITSASGTRGDVASDILVTVLYQRKASIGTEST